MADALKVLAGQVTQAAAARRPVCLRGSGSKDFYGNALAGEVLDTRAHSGVVRYEPTELVVTARCGTRLADLEALLEQNGQMLAFEPPHFGADATLGGCVAAGLSGPRRVSVGALRDFVLGACVVDGRGRVLRFGGEVMKNVAGYDVSRLLAGSLGTLGLIAEISLKVLPRPPAQASLRFEYPAARAIETLNQWAGRPLPISASAWHDGMLTLRLSGAEAAVRAATGKLGGETLDAARAEAYWSGLREQRDAYFGGDTPTWRLALPSTVAPLELPGDSLYEWNAGLRWLRSAADPQTVRDAAARAGGHATLFRCAAKPVPAFAPLSQVQMRLHRGIKSALDPQGIFNPGRLYPDL